MAEPVGPGRDGPAPEGGSARRTRLASGYFLASIVFAFFVLLWMRGFGRLLLPALVVGGIMYAVYRVVQKVREPID